MKVKQRWKKRLVLLVENRGEGGGKAAWVFCRPRARGGAGEASRPAQASAVSGGTGPDRLS